MINTSDVTVIFPAIFETWDPVWMMANTCRRFGIAPVPYGFGERYGGWVDIKLIRLLEAVKAVKTSHVLYTDASDAFFLCGLDEIVRKYNALGCPPLFMAAEASRFPTYITFYDNMVWNESKRFPYPAVGGRLDKRDSIVEALEWMIARYGDLPGDDCAWWLQFHKDRPGELAWDSDAEIFLSAGNAGSYDPCSDLAIVVDGRYDYIPRFEHLVTKTAPCIIHFNGGYSEQGRGKWYLMAKWWRLLGYTENPPWETR